MLEVMTGLRPAPQVVRWTTPEVYAVVARRSALAARRSAAGRAPRKRERLQVVRVRVCEPADGVAEAAVVVRDGPRVRAVAHPPRRVRTASGASAPSRSADRGVGVRLRRGLRLEGSRAAGWAFRRR